MNAEIKILQKILNLKMIFVGHGNLKILNLIKLFQLEQVKYTILRVYWIFDCKFIFFTHMKRLKLKK